MQISIGPLTLKLKYTDVRKDTGSIVYQRPVPKALLGRFTGKLIKHDLKTKDVLQAAKLVVALNKKYDALFAALENSSDMSPPAVRSRAEHMLKTYGVAEGDTESAAADLLIAHFDSFLETYAAGDEESHRNAVPADFLPPVELQALKMMRGEMNRPGYRGGWLV